MAPESIHEKLQRVGRPHVNLKYPVEIEGAVEEMQLPFVVGVIGDFSADGIQELPPLKEREFHEFTRDNFDSMIRKMRAGLNLAVTNELENAPDEFLCVELRLEKLDDFSPDGIIRQVPELRALLEMRNEFGQIQNDHERLARLMDLDERLTRQLRAIIHDEKFRRLEGSWRGLHYLVDNTEDATDLQIKVLCCSKRELCSDFVKAGDFDQSTMFEKVYLDVYEVMGGHPFSVIVGDYEIENTSGDLEMLAKLARVASTAFCPFLISPAASVFGMEKWTELPHSQDLDRLFAGPKFVKWNALRSSEDSRFVAMVMPRILARSPHEENLRKSMKFDFQEFELDSKGYVKVRTDLCWSNAAFYLAACITRSYAQTGFSTRILSDGNGGGELGDLWGCDLRDADGKVLMNCHTEIDTRDRQDSAILGGFGFIPAISFVEKEMTVFMSGDMFVKPKVYDRPQAIEQAKALAWLPYVLSIARIVQSVKGYVRDCLLDNYRDRQTLEDKLNHWLNEYVCVNPEPGDEVKMALPLCAGKIVLKEIPRQPQIMAATIWLQPWTLIRELTSPISVVTTLH